MIAFAVMGKADTTRSPGLGNTSMAHIDVGAATFNPSEYLAAERLQARRFAALFADACERGDTAAFYAALDSSGSNPDSWRLAMARVARLDCVSTAIRRAFGGIWVESKMLPLRVGNRRVLANALRVLMPCDYRGKQLKLFRGTNTLERKRRLYGFSWTTDYRTARTFAGGPLKVDGASVVLESVVPAHAILWKRKKERNHYDEGEVIVDPFGLKTVRVAERLVWPALR